MKYVSWFAGIGGFEVALGRAGHECVAACELAKFPRQVYKARFGHKPQYKDVRDVDPRTVPGAALWCGGFPCQDLSVAGKREGWEGNRSVLVFDWLRAAAVARPDWILAENVPGLLSVRGGADFGVLLAALADLGYVGSWRVLDARFFGVPQRRRRVFLLARHTGAPGPHPREVLALRSRGRRDPRAGLEARARVAGTLTSRAGGSRLSADDVGALVAGIRFTRSSGAGGRGRTHAGRGEDGGDGLVVSGSVAGPDGSAEGVAGTVCSSSSKGASEGRRGDLVAQALGHAERVGTPPAVADQATYSIFPEGGQGADLAAAACDVAPAVTATDGGKQSERGVRVVSFDLAQVTHPENRDRCEDGAPAPTLASSGRAHVAFSVASAASEAEDRAAHETDVARTVDTSGGYAAGQGGTLVAPTLTARAAQSSGGAAETDALVPFALDTKQGAHPRSSVLRGGDYTGAIRTDSREGVVAAGVRRLTPLECVPPGTLILGSNAPIAGAVAGNDVLGLAGMGRVVVPMQREYVGDMVKVVACGVLPLEATPEHPVLAIAGSKSNGRHGGKTSLGEPRWVRAGDVRPWRDGTGDFLLIPRLRGEFSTTGFDLAQYVAESEKHVKARKTRGLPAALPLTESMAWLLGMYVAEGSGGIYSGNGRVEFSVGLHETVLANEVASRLRSAGFLAAIDAKRTALVVRTHSSPLARLLREKCGSESALKVIPQEVLLHRNDEILRAFIAGYVAGDGFSRTLPREVRVTGANTASHALALQLQLAMARLGRFATLRRVRRPECVLEGRTIASTYFYAVMWRLEDKHHTRHKMLDRYVAVPVRSVERRQYSGTVCNMETTDHTYLVSNLVVHNCERLQGLPDGWTDIPGASDAQRYKALGNAVAVPPVEWIGRQLAMLVEGKSEADLGPASWER